MKARDGSAGDGDEAERENLARENGSGAVDEARERRQLQFGSQEDDAYAQQQDHAELDERAQVIARGEQQPYRERTGKESVDDQRPGERSAGVGEPRRQRWRIGDGLSTEDRGHDQHEAYGGGFAHAARPPVAEIQTHEDGD